MTENLLQFIWHHRLYDHSKELKTTDGDPLLIIHPGMLNTNAGPDFLEAKIKIGHTLWAGHVEVHIRSSDWQRHQHQSDPNYSRLILHVVYENDAPVHTLHNTMFATLEIKPFLPPGVIKNFELLMVAKGFIPCEKSISAVREITRHAQLERMVAERLEEKSSHIKQLLKRYNNNWQEIFYVQLARVFGLHINQDAFEQVALCTPLTLLSKHKGNLLQLEALLFGQAGFLSGYFDELYPAQLQDEYIYLKKMYSLEGMDINRWKFLRLRPAGFPTVRLALFAQLIFRSTHLFSKITAACTLKEIESLFEIRASGYWDSHYSFLQSSVQRKKIPGKAFVQTIIINAVIPTLFMFGKLQGETGYCKTAFELLQEMPPEKNGIIDQWKKLNIPVENAKDSQALLQLKRKYCDTKRCLECSIGYSIMQR